MEADRICKSINSFGESLLDELLILNYRHHIINYRDGGKSALSRGDAERKERDHSKYTSISEYIETLKQDDYSLLLNDGGIIQISFHCVDSMIQEYRYVYFPCPTRYFMSVYSERKKVRSEENLRHEGYARDQGEWDDSDDQSQSGYSEDETRLHDIEDRKGQLLGHLSSLEKCKDFRSCLIMMSPIRFEWNRSIETDEGEENKAQNEPASHVHLGFSKGRLAVSRPLTLWEFLSFVFKHYYHEEYDRFEESSKLTQQRLGKFPNEKKDCILDFEEFPFYIRPAG